MLTVAALLAVLTQAPGEVVEGPPGYTQCRSVFIGRQGGGEMERGLHCMGPNGRLELLRGEAAQVRRPEPTPLPTALASNPVAETSSVEVATASLPTRSEVEASMQGRPYTQVLAEQAAAERAARERATLASTAPSTRSAAVAPPTASLVSANGAPTAAAIRDLGMEYTTRYNQEFRLTGAPGELAIHHPMVGDIMKLRQSVTDVSCSARARRTFRCSYTLTTQMMQADQPGLFGMLGAFTAGLNQAAGQDVRSYTHTNDFTRSGAGWASETMRSRVQAAAAETPARNSGSYDHREAQQRVRENQIDFDAMRDMYDAAQGKLW